MVSGEATGPVAPPRPFGVRHGDPEHPAPDALLALVREQAARGGFATPDDYVRDLLRDLQRREAKQHIEALLLEGLHEGGEDIVVDERYWEEKIRRYEERHSGSDRA